MDIGMSIRKAGGTGLTRQELKARLARHVAQQPRSKQVFHRCMKFLEMAGLTIVVASFALAMFFSINWTTVPQTAIATAWFAFPASATPLMIFIGVHAIGLRAFYPIVLPGKPLPFATGSKAMWSGLGTIATALAAGAFWGTFAWAVGTNSVGLIMAFARILSTAMGIAISIAIVASLFQKLFRFR
jgi:hypothetical protein